MLPLVLEGIDLGQDMIEVGPGFGLATDVLRHRVTNLIAVDIEPALAGGLARRLAGTNVTVLQADCTAGTRAPQHCGDVPTDVARVVLGDPPPWVLVFVTVKEGAICISAGSMAVSADAG